MKQADCLKVQNDTIDWLRFPLACAVVLIHAGALASDKVTDFTTFFCAVTSQGISRLAVPLFFVFSGYLFFVNLETWDNSVWRKKLQRRIRTLVIPYFIWNSIAFFAAFIWEYIRCMHNGDVPYGFGAFWIQAGGWRIFTKCIGTMPYDYPLWFVRNLILFVAVSPLIHWLIKHCKAYAILLSGLFYIVGGEDFYLLQGLFFFAVGSFFSINRYNIVEIVRGVGKWIFVLAVFLLFVIVISYGRNDIYGFAVRLFTIVGSVSLYRITGDCIENGRLAVNRVFSDSSFFIYAVHPILILPHFSHYCSMRLFSSGTDFSRICTVLFDTVFTILFSLFLYYMMCRFFPKLNYILTGKKGRNKDVSRI